MRKPKEHAVLTIKLDANINEKLLKFCDTTRMTKTATIEKALDAYLDNYNKTKKIQ